MYVKSRASEITTRLLGDMYFIQDCLEHINNLVPLKGLEDLGTLDIRWSIILCTQMKHALPYHLLKLRGEEFVYDLMTRAEIDSHSRQESELRKYFWEYTLHPKRVTWAQRRKWSEKFITDTELDWETLEKDHLQK